MYNSFNGFQPYCRPNPIKCFPVTSYDEVKSAMINFDGSINVFTDIANGKIYTKGTNLDGTAFINEYVLNKKPECDPLEIRVERLEELIRGLTDESERNNTVNEPITSKSKSAGGNPADKRK